MSETELPGTGKWIDGLFADTPCAAAAQRVLQRRLRAVDRLLPLAAEQADRNVEFVHQLRVATRRSTAALMMFRGVCRRREWKATRDALRRTRRAASRARRNDVHLAMLESDARTAPQYARTAYEFLIGKLVAEREAAQSDIQSGRERQERLSGSRRLGALIRRVPLKNPWIRMHCVADRSAVSAYTLGELASAELPALIEAISATRHRDLKDPVELHGLRILGKRLRYSLELFAGCFPPRLKDELYPRIETMLDDLGEINDYVEIVSRLDRWSQDSCSVPIGGFSSCDSAAGNGGVNGAGVRREGGCSESTSSIPSNEPRSLSGEQMPPLSVLQERYRRERDQKLSRFLEWWHGDESGSLFEDLLEAVRSREGWRAGVIRSRLLAPVAVRTGETCGDPEPMPGVAPTSAPSESNLVHHRRVAAIDVGTNSIRLVVGQSDPVLRFRVIQDLKETTRLGSGVYDSGRIKSGVIESSVKAIERMKSVADACHVERIRAVGTSALREAANGQEFVDLVRQRTGITVEVIDAETEARLSFSSVANAFALDDRRVAIVDIGGGSTEVVLSAGGVIESVFPLPLGALRLTDLFARNSEIERSWFDDLCRMIDKVIVERMRRVDHPPYMIIGTGGTFTSLARVAIRHDGSPSSDAMVLPSVVRGYEMRRSEVSYFLDFLRRMPLDERRRVPGLSSQRAETIVPGVCIIERLIQFFGVSRIRVHDGGIRHGLLAEMLDSPRTPASADRPHDAGWLESARRFAERCGYEKAHSEHVAALALSIFDQLSTGETESTGSWVNLESRELLHAAAVLHDVGIAVEMRRHHRHGYDMIVHADLPTLTRREVEIIANIARYHRRRGPSARHVNFRRLRDDDQRLVRHLVSILRIADGFDRTHDQSVRAVTVEASDGDVKFAAVADSPPERNLRWARRKADVFEEVFRARARFGWAPPCPGNDSSPSNDELETSAAHSSELFQATTTAIGR